MIAAILALPSDAPAEWLVLTDGTALEIEGAPEIRERTAVFKLPGGKLASIRLDQLDLEASAERSAQKARRERTRPEPDPQPRRKAQAVLVLTDADVRHIEPRMATPVDAGQKESSGGTVDGTTQPLVVRSWGRDESEQSLAVFGVLENRGLNAAAAIELVVVTLDDSGRPLARCPAGLDVRTLLPGQRTRFEARCEEPPFFSSLDFELANVALKAGSTADSEQGFRE